jgi:hypothetical protein
VAQFFKDYKTAYEYAVREARRLNRDMQLRKGREFNTKGFYVNPAVGASRRFGRDLEGEFITPKDPLIPANPRRRSKRKRGKNPSRYRGRNVYKMTAQRPGGKVLTLVQGNKFAERGKPVHFADHASAWATAKWLQDQFPTLRRYTILVTSR